MWEEDSQVQVRLHRIPSRQRAADVSDRWQRPRPLQVSPTTSTNHQPTPSPRLTPAFHPARRGVVLVHCDLRGALIFEVDDWVADHEHHSLNHSLTSRLPSNHLIADRLSVKRRNFVQKLVVVSDD